MKRELFDLDITEEDIYKYYDYDDIMDDDLRCEFVINTIIDCVLIILFSFGLLYIDKANAQMYCISIIVSTLVISFVIIFNYYMHTQKMALIRSRKQKALEREKQRKLQRRKETEHKKAIQEKKINSQNLSQQQILQMQKDAYNKQMMYSNQNYNPYRPN